MAGVLINHVDVEKQWWSQTSSGWRGRSVLPGIEWRHRTTEGQASALALWVGVDAV